MITIIGSFAARQHENTLPDPKDIDLICSYQDFESFIERNNLVTTLISKNKFYTMWNGYNTEIEIAWPNSSGESFLKLAEGHSIDFFGEDMFVPSIDWLFTLKTSHRYLKDSPWFVKTRRDIMLMRNVLKAKITNGEWLKAREKETYLRSRPSLNRSKKAFFDGDGVSYKYDHDSIHEAVKHRAMPAYMYYKSDNAEVFCSKKKWDAVSQETKLFGVLEEGYVLALERSQIPFEGKVSPRKSFVIALQKVCTSITSGWFREYAYENYDKVMELYSDDYVEKLKAGIQNGTVQPFQG